MFGVTRVLHIFSQNFRSTSRISEVGRKLSTTTVNFGQKKYDLGGIFPPIPTPFRENESIDYDKLAHNFSIWSKAPFKGFLVEGSNGEYVYLSNSERVELIQKVKGLLPKDGSKLLLAGSGCESTKLTVEMTAKMADAGADAVMVVTPCYYKSKMMDSALMAHYKIVADNSPVPVILYNVPANTGVDMSPDVVAALASHPNIIGLKESGGDISKIGEMIHRTKEHDFQILAGSAGFLLAALQLGCVGGVCALAVVLQDVCRLHQLFMDGNISAAVQLQHSLIRPNSAVTKVHGVAGLKQAMDWLGLYGGPTRLPLQPLSESEVNMLRKVFVDAKYL